MIKDFQRAITDKDWQAIIHCWEILSGEIYTPVKVIRAATKKTSAKPKGRPKKSGAVTENTSSVARRNKFEDMVPNLKIVVDAGYDKVNDNVPLTPRTRKPFTPKSVTCISCGKTEEVAPIFARPEWKCDRCMSGRRTQR